MGKSKPLGKLNREQKEELILFIRAHAQHMKDLGTFHTEAHDRRARNAWRSLERYIKEDL